MHALHSELCRDLDVSAAASERLRARGYELHVEVAGLYRVRAQLRDLEGRVLRELSPSEVLAVACGEDLDPARAPDTAGEGGD